MAIGVARILRVGSASPPTNYGYTWKDDIDQEDIDSFVSGKTIALAYSEVGTLFQALAGTMRSARIVGRTDVASYVGEMWRTTISGPYAYRFVVNGQKDYSTTVVGRTLAQAYSGITALIAGTVIYVEIEGQSS